MDNTFIASKWRHEFRIRLLLGENTHSYKYMDDQPMHVLYNIVFSDDDIVIVADLRHAMKII